MRVNAVNAMTTCLLAGTLLLVSTGSVSAQTADGAAARVTAVAGQPFGVARVELPMSLSEFLISGREIHVTDAQGRVSYSVSQDVVPTPPDEDTVEPPARGMGRRRLLQRFESALRNLSTAPEQRATGREVWFLFRGSEPFRIQFSGASTIALDVQPKTSPAEHADLLTGWWAAYSNAAVERIVSADYPPVVETYLISMLSRRLNLPYPEAAKKHLSEREDELTSTLEMIGGSEKLRATVLQSAAAQDPSGRPLASLPVPAPPSWQDGPQIVLPDGIVIEETARHVPPECFYLRFGSFSNYLWFRDLSQLYGGDITDMISVRGVNDGGTQSIENQLCMKLTDLSRLLGATVVEDQAIIGTDLFFSEGASLGVVIKSKNRFLLETSIRSERSSKLKSVPDATLTEEQIGGHTVSLLSTPDNRLRSFLAIDGDWFFVTNSRRLVERFYAVADGETSLGETLEFQLARRLMPVDREDTLFAYFSPAMLRGMVGPKYQIELRRRLHSHADISLLRLARMAAAAEGQSLTAIEQLVAGGYLPLGFGLRPDGSGPLVEGHQIIDSQRGARGTFLPIADASLVSVTQEEADWYRRRAEYFTENWRQIDPIMVGIGRSPGENGIEQLRIHAEVAPLVAEKYGMLAQQLGPPTHAAIQFAPDDIVAAQAHVVSDQLSGTIPPHHMFAAIKDARPPEPEQLKGVLRTYLALRALPGYLGAWPQPGLLDRLPLGLGQGVEVEPGLTRLLGGLYRFQGGDFSVLSFQREVLAASLPEIAVAETDDEAQVRVHVGNLVGSQLEGWANDQLHQQAAELSQAGAEFLNQLSEQLKLQPGQAEQAAQWLLAGQLVCPLGGEYERVETARGPQWVSSQWDPTTAAPPANAPADYKAPVLQWFRGLDANLTQFEDRLVVDAVIDTQHARPGVPAPRTQPPAKTVKKADF